MPHTDQHVVIVGGTAGLGRGVAAACQAAGCTVTITGRDQMRVAAVAQELGPQVRGVALDVANSASITEAFGRLERIDHLVLVAFERYHNTIREYRAKEAERLVQVKLVGYAEVIHQALSKLDPRLKFHMAMNLMGEKMAREYLVWLFLDEQTGQLPPGSEERIEHILERTLGRKMGEPAEPQVA